jgi:hypothetical protein
MEDHMQTAGTVGDDKRRPLAASIFYRWPVLSQVLAAVNSRFQFQLLRFYRDPAVVRNIASIIRDFDLQMQPFDAFTLHTLAAMQADLPGVMAEVGVYRGGSSKIISLASGGRETYSFDTFSGLPQPKEVDTYFGLRWFKNGQYAADYDSVVRSLSEFPNLHFVRGFFPESGDVLKDKRISFANVDVDLYQGTLDSLRFLWPLLLPGGVILVHDSHALGVRQAVNEFITSIPDARRFACGGSQVALVKRTRLLYEGL